MTATVFLTPQEFRRFVGLLETARQDRVVLTSSENAELVRLSEKASDFEHRDAEEALDVND